MNSEQTVSLKEQAVLTANKSVPLDNKKHIANPIMDKNLNIANSDFSDDQLEQSGFSFSNNVSENGRDSEQSDTISNDKSIDVSESVDADKNVPSISVDSKKQSGSNASNAVSTSESCEISEKVSKENNSPNEPGDTVPSSADKELTASDNKDSKEVNDSKTILNDNHNKNHINETPEPSDSVKDIMKVNTLIDDIMKKTGLDGSGKDERNSEENEPEKPADSTEGAKTTANLKEIDNHPTESENIAEKSEGNNERPEDEGDGTLYIDEGNDEGKHLGEVDSDGEVKRTKDILDTDTEEEEEDEDEKAFGVNIKEKKKKIKQAMGNKPVEKIDLETFKSEWSDEEDGNEETEKIQGKQAGKSLW